MTDRKQAEPSRESAQDIAHELFADQCFAFTGDGRQHSEPCQQAARRLEMWLATKPADDGVRKVLARLIEMDDDAAAASGEKGNLNGVGLVDLFDLVGHPFGSGEHKQQPYRSNQLEVALADARAALQQHPKPGEAK